MKNKIILGSVTLLSAFILAACGIEKRRQTKQATPTTEVTKETTACTNDNKLKQQLLGLLLGQKKYPFADTSTYRKEKFGYINIPKDWVVSHYSK
ncbi:MAG: hypothetical protein ACLRZG_08620 [Streptococcus sp.]